MTQPLMADVQAIQGQVNVGVTIANYGPVVGTAETALTQLLNKYNTGAATRGNECATLVSIPLGTAQVDYSDALSTWNSCIQNGSGDCSSGLQSKWSDADAQITKAVNGLAGLKPKS